MPANLTPQYSAAEEEYKKAKTPEEKLAGLKKMFLELPKHKGTEKIQAALKTKMSEAREEIEKKKTTSHKTTTIARIPKQGAGQLVLIGAPNVGKSSLLSKVTHATPAVAPYPFTTREPHPGMMDTDQVKIQLIDLPPVTRDHLESWQANLIRNADAAFLMIDLGDDDGLATTQDVIDRLREAKIKLLFHENTTTDPEYDWIRCLVIGNKIDLPDWEVRKELYGELLGQSLPWCCLSCGTGAGLDEFKHQVFRLLQVIRVYSKQPGKPVDKKAPFTIPHGSTVIDMAEHIHRDLAKNFKHARIWGTGVIDGQTVGREHELRDGDIVEIHE
jgi:ribosome-interacting GTPase 1